jgi:hypothetical protein
MTELQAYYARLANNTYNRANYLASCANASITDKIMQDEIVNKCGILSSAVRTATNPEGLSTCLANVPGATPGAAYKDILCSRYESIRTQTNENDQRMGDARLLLRMEQEKTIFRILGIVGVLVGSVYL